MTNRPHLAHGRGPGLPLVWPVEGVLEGVPEGDRGLAPVVPGLGLPASRFPHPNVLNPPSPPLGRHHGLMSAMVKSGLPAEPQRRNL